MPIDKSKLTDEMLAKAAMCQTAEQLIELAKTERMEITKAEAEAYLAEMDNVELDNAVLDKVARGIRNSEFDQCPSHTCNNFQVH